MPTEYAHALYHSLKDVTSEAEVTTRMSALMRVLRKAGKMKALPTILREFTRIHERNAARQATLTVARETDLPTARAALAARLPGAHSDVAAVVDDTLIGGWRYVHHDTLIDTSHKAALLALYRRITKH